MSFGFTLQDEAIEGFGLTTPEGAVVTDVTARAAEFTMWLRDHVVPSGMPMVVNTEWGVEDGIPDAPVPDVPLPGLITALLSHLGRRHLTDRTPAAVKSVLRRPHWCA
ncbi:hypothetical protein GCM10010420_36680 [Streptomyces glaucosporus]|uniref:Uncharacterized protein n=1 Tax=Streptomyces glaucosporus TaxID=284044 RepID=A0ABP5VKI4_9ACTN